MFIKLTHGLHNVINAIVSYLQRWSDDSVPPDTKTLHNFKDGLGKKPAVPLDEIKSRNDIVDARIDANFISGNNSFNTSENVLKVELKTELGSGKDDITSNTNFTNVTCNPNPIIFEIQNEVPDKIEKIIPIKTQALPGQDFIFKILYTKEYVYIDGDILPVFGEWGRYAKLSKDGTLLTVNSDADLTVRLILTPAPQEWIPEKPDPGIIQEPTDKTLDTIPFDCSKADFTLEKSEIENNFYNVTIDNQNTTMVTNSEMANGKYYNVQVNNNTIKIPMIFVEGFDEHDLYWKCYEDPKSPTPAEGEYPTKDYNEEYNLPSGYRKLQYITPNDGAYIDLGIKLKKDYKVKILMNVTYTTDNGYIGLFGARNSTDTDFYTDNHTNGAYSCYTRYNYNSIGYQRGTKRVFSSNDDSSRIYGKINWWYSTGTSFEVQDYNGNVIRKITLPAEQNIDTEWNCYLFAVNDKGSPYQYRSKGNLYRCEIWDENDNLIMRLIPALNLNSNRNGLYDVVNDKYYYNQKNGASFGGTPFYVWQKQIQCSDPNAVMYIENNDDIDFNIDYEIPDDYEKLYAIYSKESYLNTNYKVKKDDRVECMASVDNNTSSSYRVLYGSRQSSFSDDNYFIFTRFNSNNIACYGKNAKETTISKMTYGEPCKFVSEPNKLSCYNAKNVLLWEINVDGTPVDCRYNCWLGCGNNNNSIDSWEYAKYYYFRIYDKDNNLVLNLIPARRKSDKVIGFYNTITNTFMTRTSGNYAYEAIEISKLSKRLLHIDNITQDINLGIIKNPIYDNPFKLEDCIEDEINNKPIDEISYNYEFKDSKILDYFYVTTINNQATDYVSVDNTYKTSNVGNNVSFVLSYKSGYDNYDIKGTSDVEENIEITKALHITYNELDIPSEYTPVKGLINNNSSTYFKTGYIPKWNDRIVCYCNVSNNYPTYPSYVFGCCNSETEKSFMFYGHSSNDSSKFAFARNSAETKTDNIFNQLLQIDFSLYNIKYNTGYSSVEYNTNPKLYRSFDYQDYNKDVVLPDNYTKLSYISRKQTSNAFIDLNRIIKTTDKVDAIINVNSSSTKSNVVLFGATTKSGTTIAEQTTTKFTYPMRYDSINNYWVNTNQNKDSTNSELEFKMKISGSLVLNVTQSSEVNYDYLIIQKNGSQVTTTQGLSGSRTITLSNLNVNDVIKIYYKKDGSQSRDKDTATVQIVYNDLIVDSEFTTSEYSETNILYTKYGGTNSITLKQNSLFTNTNFVYDDTVKLKMDGTKISWWNFKDEFVSELEYESSYNEPIYNTYLFGINENGNYKNYDGNSDIYLYSFKLYDKDDNLVMNLIPALNNNDNEYGLYDIVTNTFFTNSGDDEFEGHVIEEIYYYSDDCDYEMYVFGCNWKGSNKYPIYGNIYKFIIYNNDGDIVLNLVPVKRISDNKLGFYETISQRFILPSAGAVTEATEPTYKSSLIVSNIPCDNTVTIVKNNDARKNIYLEEGIEDDVNNQNIDQLENNFELLNSSINDWFTTVKYINQTNISSIVAQNGSYNTPRTGTNTRFPITYNIGFDNSNINVTANNGAIAEVTEPLKIVYETVPDEYIIINGLYNNNTNTYFLIDYLLKSTDSVKLYFNDTKNSYTYYIFGACDNETSNSFILCSRYENNNNFYYSRNKRINMTDTANEVIMMDCKPNEITYTNGYDTYHYTLDNTPTNCTKKLHIFGCNWNNSHSSSFTGTIYKFTIYDDNGIKYNLIPVQRKIDNVLGFYDTIGDMFYIPAAGSVSSAQPPKYKGSIIVSNITTETDISITEKQMDILELDNDNIESNGEIVASSITDRWCWFNINNTATGEITFSNFTYGTCYVGNIGTSITLPCSYKSGRTANDFIVSYGTLTNNGIVISEVKEDMNITVMLNDYHDPKSETNDDLNIFTDPDFSNYNQYRVINGADNMLSSYSFINSQIAAMIDKDIFEFDLNEIDILNFNPNNIPGEHIKAKIVSNDANCNEVVKNVTVDGKTMYKHTITLKNQIKLENGKTYIFKVRDNTDTDKLIAYAKDTTQMNLVNSNGEYTPENNDVYFNWNESNKYIVKGNKAIYFEINGIKL